MRLRPFVKAEILGGVMAQMPTDASRGEPMYESETVDSNKG
jgi:hypothetical protein